MGKLPDMTGWGRFSCRRMASSSRALIVALGQVVTVQCKAFTRGTLAATPVRVALPAVVDQGRAGGAASFAVSHGFFRSASLVFRPASARPAGCLAWNFCHTSSACAALPLDCRAAHDK